MSKCSDTADCRDPEPQLREFCHSDGHFVIPTEVEESLTSFRFSRAESQKDVRDVSTSLDMTGEDGPLYTSLRQQRGPRDSR